MTHPLLAVARRGDLDALRFVAAEDPAALRAPQLVVAAAQRSDVAVLELLLAAGADANATWRNYRPLHALIQEEPHAGPRETSPTELAALDLLLAHGADPELLGAWPLMRATVTAALAGRRVLLERLFVRGARRDGFVAAASGDQEVVARTLAADPGFASARDRGGLTALQMTAGSRLGAADAGTAAGLLAVARLLLDAGADPNATTRSWGHDVDVAYFACASEHRALLELLLARGAEASRALPSACWRERTDLAELVVAAGADVDARHDGGRPLLNELVRWGNARWATWLLARGANPNLADERGWTALHQAASRGSVSLVEALIAAGADRRRPDAEGNLPSDLVSKRSRGKLLALLASA